MARFEKTSCSQCGGEFGPGDHGYSHCSTRVKKDPMAATLEIENMRGKLRYSPNRLCDICCEAEATHSLYDETYFRSEERVCRECLDRETERAAERKAEDVA